MNPLPVLIVEDDQDLLEVICETLKLAGYHPVAARNGAEALTLLQENTVGMVVSDIQMQPIDGFVLLQKIKAFDPDLPVMLMTAYGEIDKAIIAMRNGACDFVVKPFEPNDLLAQLEQYALKSPEGDQDIIARDTRTRELLSLARRVAESTATVMLTGESGCGKEVIARYIHQHSSRSRKPFVAINCAAIPDNLLEATLFGYEKGAFTGATRAQPGKFEQADGGTLLLDEISEMPLDLQAKLLRVLQEREVERVGGHQIIKLDFRLLTTSNRDMPKMVKNGKFREDLYYRLNVFPIEIPPLRERPLDIEPLSRHFMNRVIAESPQYYARSLSQEAIDILVRYHWPGNVRELENVIQRAMILAVNTAAVEAEHISLADACIGQQQTDVPVETASLDMKALERKHIMDTLAAVNGSRKLAVQRLGISERTLRYKLQQYRASGF
ncbi:sigma-54-dependent transcriptional regulator [Nitrosomonas marina]|uniref:Two-component system, response regulator FlrC n=1 Tax=Nitrosomonas marina TaxID=917 RepID=A0A1H8FH96_9PROT|nr:sigma-54 dependent transcriptional regulator [Nitrosomonas marina]SEN31221.1 two-component system, response regulator FlrC [Nitrosomonas marina]